MELPIVANDVIEVAEDPRQQQGRLSREKREGRRRRRVVIEIKGDEADGEETGPRQELRDCLGHVADDDLGVGQAITKDVAVHGEIARPPDIGHVLVATRFGQA